MIEAMKKTKVVTKPKLHYHLRQRKATVIKENAV